MATYEQYKFLTGKICDKLIYSGSNAEFSSNVETLVMHTRKTKGYKAALLSGLIVGALMERGEATLAEKFLIEIGKRV